MITSDTISSLSRLSVGGLAVGARGGRGVSPCNAYMCGPLSATAMATPDGAGAPADASVSGCGLCGVIRSDSSPSGLAPLSHRPPRRIRIRDQFGSPTLLRDEEQSRFNFFKHPYPISHTIDVKRYGYGQRFVHVV